MKKLLKWLQSPVAIRIAKGDARDGHARNALEAAILGARKAAVGLADIDNAHAQEAAADLMMLAGGLENYVDASFAAPVSGGEID